MKIKLSKNELYRKLKTVGKIVQPIKSLQAAETFKFDFTEDALTISGTDIMGVIKGKNITCEKEPGACSFLVDAKILLNVLVELPEQPIELEVTDKKMVVTYSSGHFEVPLIDADIFPVIDTNGENSSFEMSAEKIINGINQVIGCAANDELRPVMNGVFLEIGSGKLSFVSTDAHRLAIQEIEIEEELLTSAIVPTKATKIILNILSECKKEDSVKITVNQKNITVETDNYELIYRLIDGRYPNYMAVIPHNKDVLEFNRMDLISALKRISIFSNPKTSKVVLDISETKMVISASYIDYGISASEEFTVHADFDLKIAFKSHFILELLNSLPSDECRFLFSEPNRGVLIKPMDSDNVTLLIMPMQID